MLLCAVPALLGHQFASWTTLAVASLAALARVNNPSQLWWFILCYISPLNTGGSHTWTAFLIGMWQPNCCPEPWSVHSFGSHPSPCCDIFWRMAHHATSIPARDWSSAVGQMLQDTGAWQLCWSREPTAFGYPGFMCPARGPFGETWKAGRWSEGPQVHIICLTIKCQQLFISIIYSSWCCVLTLSCK